MDLLIKAAAQALAEGDALGALNRVALREDAAALALRGIAIAQLGDLNRARPLLNKAARLFGPKHPLERARCVLAEAEIAFVTRDLGWSAKALNEARLTLEEHGDRLNAAFARLIEARRLLLIGRVDDAERALADIDSALSPTFKAAYELTAAGVALRRLQAGSAQSSLERAERAALRAGIPGLQAEVEAAQRVLNDPVACLISNGEKRLVTLDTVEEVLGTGALVVDGCRSLVRRGNTMISLSRSPVLFALAKTLAEAWPGDATRNALVEQAFELEFEDEDRLHLRVEISRLRDELGPLAEVVATKSGFALVPRQTHHVVLFMPPVVEENANVLALLGDGELWSSSALALALGSSQRTVQRALESLSETGKVQSVGRGRSLRWIVAPVPSFATPLLLQSPFPSD